MWGQKRCRHARPDRHNLPLRPACDLRSGIHPFRYTLLSKIFNRSFAGFGFCPFSNFDLYLNNFRENWSSLLVSVKYVFQNGLLWFETHLRGLWTKEASWWGSWTRYKEKQGRPSQPWDHLFGPQWYKSNLPNQFFQSKISWCFSVFLPLSNLIITETSVEYRLKALQVHP